MAVSATSGSISVTTGIASGIDYEAIIDASLKVEQVPIDNLETKKSDYQSEISALGEVKSSLSTFQDAVGELADSWDFFSYASTSSDDDILSTEVTGDASAGTYQVKVSQVAAPAIIMGSSSFSSTSDTVGGGTISIQVGTGDQVDVAIGSDSTLSDIKSAINQADAGVTASIVQVSDGTYTLALIANESGQDITFSISDDDNNNTDSSGLSALYADPSTGSMTVAQAAAKAQYSMGDMNFESSSNEITGLIPGVTLSLNNADPDTTVTVKVKTDTSAMSDKIQSMVDAYNSFEDLMEKYQDKGDDSSYGILFGDTTTNNLRSRMRQLIFTKVDNGESNITYLSRLGVEMGDDGHLTFDKDTFKSALSDDPESVMNFFTKDSTGLADTMNSTLNSYLKYNGIFAAKIDGLQSSVDRTSSKIDYLNDKLTTYEARLRKKYADLETLLSSLTNTQSSLTSALSSLTTSSSSS